MKNILIVFILISHSVFSLDQKFSVHEFLQKLGEPKYKHFTGPYSEAEKNAGKELFFSGQTKNPQNGELGSRISQVYTCNHCHNNQIEDPDLTINDPETRLSYAVKNKKPFLQGTTMYGSVNRSTWFNDDYLKKYGEETIKPARENFINAVKLCSKECSVGRDLEKWELRSMLAYLWSLEYKLSDLNFTDDEKKVIQNYSDYPKQKVIKLVKSKFLGKSAAHFVEPPEEGSTYGHNPDPERGRQIYELSCLNCHSADSTIPKILKFRERKATYRYLSKYKHNYLVLRKGADSEEAYMPHYSIERLSNKQADDFYAFILSKLQ